MSSIPSLLNPEDQGLSQPLSALAQGLPPDWAPLVGQFLASTAGQALAARLDQRRAAGAVIYPRDPFRALRLTPRAQVRVVILGQDPYHGPGQAEGLAFSVPPGVRIPPSLRNIYLERARDLGVPPSTSGSLTSWARQGVLLLNTTLTVEDGQPASHSRWGWDGLTRAIIDTLRADPAPKVFLLWGAHAQALLPEAVPPHLILSANHPSPLSARRGPVPFLGCGHFSAARSWLAAQGPGSGVGADIPLFVGD